MHKRPDVCVSIDVDTVHHYAFLAPEGWEGDDPILLEVMPRILDMFDELGITATLFVIGDTVKMHRRLWRRAVEAGHEIASHSLTHVQNFHELSLAQKRREVEDSKRIIEDCTGHQVLGFRAPAYNIDHPTLELLVEAGYSYDSSLFPGWYVPFGKAVLRLRAQRPKAAAMSSIYLRHWRLPNHPFCWNLSVGNLLEVPLASGRLGMPYMGTVHLLMPTWFFKQQTQLITSLGRPIVYELHPTEVLDRKTLGDSPWLRRIPGVGGRADPWSYLRYRLQHLQVAGATRLIRDLRPVHAPTVHPRHR